MKKLKGCLIIFMILSLLIVGGIYFFIQKLNNKCIEDHNKAAISFAELKSQLQKRNELLKVSNFPDSVKILSQKSDSILSATTDAHKLIWTEFKLNEKTYKSDSLKSINSDLNTVKNQFNADLRNFTFNWVTFPFNLIKMNQKFPKYNYLEIDYGISNLENMNRRKKTENWVETGEWK